MKGNIMSEKQLFKSSGSSVYRLKEDGFERKDGVLVSKYVNDVYFVVTLTPNKDENAITLGYREKFMAEEIVEKLNK